MNQREKGNKYENMACLYLKKKGMYILERNYRISSGEVDIIGKENGYLVFVEVKYRKSNEKGYPEEAVGFYKQRKICSVSDYYRLVKGYSMDTPVRYDVICFLGEECHWYQNAFEHISLRG